MFVAEAGEALVHPFSRRPTLSSDSPDPEQPTKTSMKSSPADFCTNCGNSDAAIRS